MIFFSDKTNVNSTITILFLFWLNLILKLMSYNGGVFCYTQPLQLSYILPVILTVVYSSHDFNCCGDIVLDVAFLVVFLFLFNCPITVFLDCWGSSWSIVGHVEALYWAHPTPPPDLAGTLINKLNINHPYLFKPMVSDPYSTQQCILANVSVLIKLAQRKFKDQIVTEWHPVQGFFWYSNYRLYSAYSVIVHHWLHIAYLVIV